MAIPGLRFIVLITSSICLTSIFSNMATYNFTKICIDTANDNNFTKTQKAWLQSSVAVGALGSAVPYTYLFSKFQTRYIFFSAGVISVVATALIPIANKGGFAFFITARIVQGIGFSAAFPVVGTITADWATLSEHGLFVGLLTGCAQLSNIFTMPVSGALCTSSLGPSSVYYVHAAIGAIAFTFWIIFFRDKPADHWLISEGELLSLQTGKSKMSRAALPLRQMLLDPVLWGVWIAALGDFISVQLVTMFNPQFMNKYLHYNVMNSGFMAALPIIVQFFVKLIGGISSDKITFLSETLKVRIYNSLALAASAIFFVGLAFVPAGNKTLSVSILIFAESLIGFNTAGFNKCATLHSRQHTHFVMIQIMIIWAITILIEPFIVNGLVQENVYADWRNCFLVHAAILLLSNLLFVITADAKPASWTFGDSQKADKSLGDEKMKDEVGAAPSAAAKPADTTSAAAKPGEAAPADAKPEPAKPADATPADGKPADAQPAGAKPADVQPAGAKPADAQPTGAKAADAPPAAGKPADAPSAGAKPAAAAAAEAKPAEPAPDAKPADGTPADANPEGTGEAKSAISK